MSKYELTMSPDYVEDWRFEDAIRELHQNALDQEISDPENVFTHEYRNNCIFISSKNSVLEKSSLLLGSTTKSRSKDMVGQYGEGYKLALLVLSRLGYDVKIFNYGAKEVWTPRIIKSRRYGCDILCIEVKRHFFTSVPDSNLTFKIDNVDQLDYSKVIFSFLQLQKYEKIDTPFGEVLIDEEHRGQIFVNGLFVSKCEDDKVRYGYNVNPEHLSLDRDRKLIDTFSLTWMTSELWSKSKDVELVTKLIREKAPDVEFISNFLGRAATKIDEDALANALLDAVQTDHGLDVVPVNDQFEADGFKKRFKNLHPVVYPGLAKIVESHSSTYKDCIHQCNAVKKDFRTKSLLEASKMELLSALLERCDVMMEGHNELFSDVSKETDVDLDVRNGLPMCNLTIDIELYAAILKQMRK